MISEKALSRAARPAILGRADKIVRRYGALSSRVCDYEGGVTRLSADVVSSEGRGTRYQTTISLDEARDEVVDYSCTCPAYFNYPGPCKHSVALALDFRRNPQAWLGYSELLHVTTTPSLATYLDRAGARQPQASPKVTDEAPGSISLGLELAFSTGVTARLKVRGASGSYVVKDIGELVANVADHAYHYYGKKMAFVHDPAIFDEVSRSTLAFLTRCVRNRQAYALERTYGRSSYGYYGYRPQAGSGLAAVGREISLSGPELAELLDIWDGRQVLVTSEARSGRSGSLRVQRGDPPVSLTAKPMSEGGYELVRHGGYDFVSVGDQLVAIGSRHLWRCTERLAALSDFLTSVYSGPGDHILLAERDVARFAATTLPELEEGLRVEAPAALEALRPVPGKVTFYLDRTGGLVTCDAVVAYGDKSWHVLNRQVGQGVDPGRDLDLEMRVRALVSRYLTGAEGRLATLDEGDHAAVARLVFEGVASFRAVGQVMATPSFEALASRATPRVKVRASVSGHLINLDVSATDLPLADLHALLSSYRKKKRFHRLSDGSFVDLRDLDLDEVALVADELGLSAKELAAGHAELPSYKAFLLDTLVGDEEKDESFDTYVEGFRSVDPTVYQPPASLAKVLRPYQVQGFQWLSALADMGFGGILADEMGLGKSVQLISFLLAHRGEGPTLVVCPASLVYNWQAEFEKFAPQMDVAVVAGTADERHRERMRRGHEVFVTSYDLVRRDVEEWAALPLWCCVLDEAQYIKNHETLAARAVKALSARQRFALTGTPVENRLSELWSIFDFLMPGLLGSYDRFRDRYEQPIIDGDDEVAERLRQAVGPFIMRRLKSDVLRDLPDKLEQVVYARMEGEQRRLYDGHEQALRLSLTKQVDAEFSRGKMQVLAELTRLRELCCDPRLVYEDYDGPSCKLETVVELVGRVVDAGEKMLVFSQFTSYLALIEAELDRQGVAHYKITGATPKRRRLELVDAFNADDTPVFLISLKAGGTGLNLTGASVVVHADPWWNSAAQDQATDRAHRIGQTKQVTVYKVIARDTVEDRILALQESKADLADQVVGKGGGASLGSLRREDLIDLLG